MALSTLEAQLAALKDTKHGSVAVSNKRHEDAVGRGLHYSVQFGQKQVSNFYQPSLIYKSSKEAADIPLSHLEQKYEMALQALAAVYPGGVILPLHDKQKLPEFLVSVGSILIECESVNMVYESCVDILECLLRKYHIHREYELETFWSLVALDQFSGLVSRFLSLVDWAVHPSYLWLRNYNDGSVPSRSVLAKYVFKNLDVLRQVLSFTRNVAQLNNQQARVGTRRLLSFSAAIFLEGLQGTFEHEPVLRTLLPYLQLANASGDLDWRSWGLVVTSAVCEVMELTSSTANKLCDSILQSRPDSDALACILVLLQQTAAPDFSEFLLIEQNDGSESLLGCCLTPSTSDKIIEAYPDISSALGELYSNRRLVVSPFLASFLLLNLSDTKLVEKMINQQALYEVWRDPRIHLVASFAQRVVSQHTVNTREILLSLHQLDAVATEEGLARAMKQQEDKNVLDGLLDIKNGLPARMAMDDADDAVRIEAIRSLSNIDSGIWEKLLRCSCDSNIEVQDAAVDKLRSVLKNGFVPPKEMAGLALSAAIKSSEFLHVAGIVVSLSAPPDVWQAAVQFIASKLRIDDLCIDAVKALHFAFGVDNVRPTLPAAKKLLVGSEAFLASLLDFKGTSQQSQSAWRQAVLVYLDAMQKEKNAADVLGLCLSLLRQSNSSECLSSGDCEIVSNFLQSALRRLASGSKEAVPSTLIALASIESDGLWSRVAVPSFESMVSAVKDRNQQPVSPLQILMEAAVRVNLSSKVVKRILAVVADSLHTSGDDLHHLVVPLLCLLSSPDSDVRVHAMKIWNRLLTVLTDSTRERQFDDPLGLVQVCKVVVARQSSSKLGGKEFLSIVLSECVAKKASDSEKTKETLLSLCVCAATCSTLLAARKSKLGLSWLAFGKASGGCYAASVVLEAMEYSGEDAFPLVSRWKFAGAKLLKWFLTAQGSFEEKEMASLAHCISRMIKGVTIRDQRVAISSGPELLGGGGRARSYSVGKFDGCTLLEPYPDDMTAAVIDLFSEGTGNDGIALLSSTVISDVLQSSSWREGIFKSLTDTQRRDLAGSLLVFITRGTVDAAEEAFMGLPLSVSDVTDLVERASKIGDVTRESLLVDFVLSNAETVSSAEDSEALLSMLFNQLERHTTEKEPDDPDGSSFIVQSALQAARKLLDVAPQGEINNRRLNNWKKTMVSLIGAEGNLHQVFRRSRPISLSVMLSLTRRFPNFFAGALVPAVLSSVGLLGVGAWNRTPNSFQVFQKVIPVYLKCSDDVADLFLAFVRSTAKVDKAEDRLQLYVGLVAAFSHPDVPASKKRNSLASLVAVFLAGQVFESATDLIADDAVSFAVEVIEKSPVSMQLDTLLLLVRYARGMTATSSDEFDGEEEPIFNCGLTSSEIGVLAAFGLATDTKKHHAPTEKSLRAVNQITLAILRVVFDSLVIENVRNTIQGGDDSSTKGSLQLWQELLMLQSSTTTVPLTKEKDTRASESLLNYVSASCSCVQELLPIHIFLASASSLVQEGGTTEVRIRALRLIADRTATLDPGSPEIVLFLDVVPMAVQIADSYKSSEASGTVLAQSALVVVEHIARYFYSVDASGRKGSHKKMFLSALECCAKLLIDCDSSSGGTLIRADASVLPSSAALCAATLIRALGPSCLPVLAKLMAPVVRLMQRANTSIHIVADTDKDTLVAQLAVLRVLISVAEKVPQFLPPHLPSLFTEHALLSTALRKDNTESDIPVNEAVELLDEKLSLHVPPRLLIPILAQALAKSTSTSSSRVLLSIMQSAVGQATSSIVGGSKDVLLRCITRAFQTKSPDGFCMSTTRAGCDLFDAIVLKISEVQFNQLFNSLIGWRDEKSASVEEVEWKRYSFWLVCSRLSKDLRTIFLPCLTLVLNDLLSELKSAVAGLQSDVSKVSKSSDGSKKRKVDSAIRPGSLRVLRVVLMTLEHALRSDAYQGGTWVRDEENERFDDLLAPLGKLLLSTIRRDATDGLGSDYDYSSLVAGNSSGSVVMALTALASAGGNEQRWKPLNHAVLQACGDESRSEVRRAGLLCLLEIMKSLGEEYMALLPENLPLLAELLEDTNEEVAGLARQVVALAEDLTGESLEENLR